MRTPGWKLLVLSAALCAGGCSGWYLRGTQRTNVDLTSVYVSGASAPQLRIALNQALVHSGVEIVGSRDRAQAVVELANERYDRRVLSVDPDTGKVREVELEMEAQYAVRTPDGALLAPQQTLSWVNDFVFDEGSLLGTVEQEQLLKIDLAEDAAHTIMLRLETLELPKD